MAISYIIRHLEIDVSTVKGDYILPTKPNNATLKWMGYIKQGNEWRKKLEIGPQRIRREAKESKEAEQAQQARAGSSSQPSAPQDF